MMIITQLLCIDIHYFFLLQNHTYMPSTCYYLVTIVLSRHYCFIITQLQICMSITSNYYKIITTSLLSIIAMVLHISLVLLRHYCCITNMYVHYLKLLQDHYYIITLYYCHGTAYYYLITTKRLFSHGALALAVTAAVPGTQAGQALTGRLSSRYKHRTGILNPCGHLCQ